jgi:DNA-binding transcriptional LysR family regulator
MESLVEDVAEGVTLDQLRVFVAVVDSGSFSAAARSLKRAQSAITYTVQGLELQTGSQLFDRSGYRASLTPVGAALLPRARRVIEAANVFRQQASSLVRGLETRLSVVVDAFVPIAPLIRALAAFRATFPLVDVSITRQSLDATARMLREGQATLGVLIDSPPPDGTEGFACVVCGTVEQVPVAAPHHPLADMSGPIRMEQLRDHMQILLSADPQSTGTDDKGTHAMNRWRVNDLDLRHRMILEGLGWGTMPGHLVAEDLEWGRLVVLPLDPSDPANRMFTELTYSAAHPAAKPLGPAGRWLVSRLVEEGAASGGKRVGLTPGCARPPA